VVSIATNAVTFVDTATNAVKGTAYVGRAPHEAFYTPDGKEVWVSVRGEDYVSVIDAGTMRESGRIGVPDGPGMVRFRGDGAVGFVVSSFTPEAVAVDVKSHQVVARIPVTSPFFRGFRLLRIVVIVVLFIFSTVFWSAYEQAPTSLTLFARDFTDRHIFGFELPAGALQSTPAVFVILFAPVFATNKLPVRSNAMPFGKLNPKVKVLFTPPGVILVIAPPLPATKRSPAPLKAKPTG